MKNRNYIIVVVILLAIAAYFYFNNPSGTIKPELRDFAIEDTSSITKVFMVNKNNKSILLEKEGSIWYVNGEFIARKDAVDLILKTFKRIDIKSPVPKAQFDNVVKRLAATNTKVEVYTDDDQPSKVIFIGGPTQDQRGTYMMIENSSTPFITHIPGFSGYLSSRFFLEEDLWRDQVIFRYGYNMIKSVQLEDIRKGENSFKLTNNGDNKYELLNLSQDKYMSDFDTIKVKYYLALYKKLSFERIANELDSVRIDSITATDPIYKITLEDTNNKITSIETYLRPSTLNIANEDRDKRFDIERMYARINNSEELVIIQYYSFDPLFMDIDFFMN